MELKNWFKFVQKTTVEVRACWESIQHELTTQGSIIPLKLTAIGPSDYANGTFFFSQIKKLVEGSMGYVDSLSERLNVQESEQEFFLDTLARYQRALFEALLVLIALSGQDVLAADKVHYYLLHYHLTADLEEIKRVADDIKVFCGIPDGRKSEILKIENQLGQLAPDIDLTRCIWVNGKRRSDAKRMLALILEGDTSDMERAALGFTYTLLFGETSSRIHLHMSGLSMKLPPEIALRVNVEQTVALNICVVLRALMFFEKGAKCIWAEGQNLRDTYETNCPNTYLSAIAGPAEKGDLVFVKDINGNYYGLVAEISSPKKKSQYPAYKIGNINGSADLWHISPNISLVATVSQQKRLLLDAAKGSFLTFVPSGNHKHDIRRALPELITNFLSLHQLMLPLLVRNTLNFSLFEQETISASP